MKWPWVSRAAHEAQYREYAEKVAEMSRVVDRELVAAGRRYDDLLSRYHQLKLQGFGEPEQRVVTPTVAPVRDAVMLAVNTACAGKDVRVRRAMLDQVAVDRTKGVPDEEIVRRILQGNRPQDEFTTADSTSTPSNPGATAVAS